MVERLLAIGCTLVCLTGPQVNGPGANGCQVSLEVLCLADSECEQLDLGAIDLGQEVEL